MTPKTQIPTAKYITATWLYQSAMLPATTGPITLAIDIELNTPFKVDLEISRQ